MEVLAPHPEHDYKVVILCYTYNQERYIEDALKGFVRQKTDFPFCAVVIDDCSTDGNVNIIKQYENLYPEIIKGIYLPENMYSQPEKKDKYTKPWEDHSEYLAYCEGDDYWIDDKKLQRQVDFLDQHSDYTMYLHNALVRYQDKDLPDRIMSNFTTGDFNTEKLFEKWQLPLASILIRRSIFDTEIFKELSVNVRGGFLLFLAATKTGKVYGLSECLSVYRKNDGGVSNGMSMSYCVQVECDYAKAAKDKGAIKVKRKEITKVLMKYLPKLLLGEKEAWKILKIAYGFDHSIPVRALVMFLFVAPAKLCKRIVNYR